MLMLYWPLATGTLPCELWSGVGPKIASGCAALIQSCSVAVLRFAFLKSNIATAAIVLSRSVIVSENSSCLCVIIGPVQSAAKARRARRRWKPTNEIKQLPHYFFSRDAITMAVSDDECRTNSSSVPPVETRWIQSFSYHTRHIDCLLWTPCP